jgi:hypothetical protein
MTRHVDAVEGRVQSCLLRALRPRHLRDGEQCHLAAVMDVVSTDESNRRALCDHDHVVRRRESHKSCPPHQ